MAGAAEAGVAGVQADAGGAVIPMPTQIEKLQAHASHLLDAFIQLRERYALLEPMLFNESVAKERGSGRQARGFRVLKNSLFLSCAQDIAKLTLDDDERTPSLANVICALSDDNLRARLKEQFALRKSPLAETEDDPEVLEALRRWELSEEVERREQFDALYCEATHLWAKLSTSALIKGFRTIRDKVTAHTEVRFVADKYQFVDIDDAYSTGSSIMPQKKNPDIAELVRGKTGRVYGALTSILTTMKGIPLAYNKDMQEDKELTFDAIDTVKGCIALFTGMVSTMEFRKDVMEASAKNGFTNATDAADYLVNHGVPFRDAHGIVGKLVLTCIEKKIPLDELPLEEYRKISPVFEEDIYKAIDLETCVNKRVTIGAPGKDAMAKSIAAYQKYMEEY